MVASLRNKEIASHLSVATLFSKASFNTARGEKETPPQNPTYLLLLANPQGGTKEKSDIKDHRQLLY